MKFFRNLFIIGLVLLVFVVGIFYRILSQPGGNGIGEANFVTISGEGVKVISQNLSAQGFISNKLVFELYVWWKGLDTKFIAGTFIIPEDSSIKDIVELLTSLTPASEITLQFIEGWTTKDISDYLIQERIIATQDEFNEWNQVSKWQDTFSFLTALPGNDTLEGYLFPDTYNFFVDATVKDIIFKMLTNFDNKLTVAMRSDIATAGSTIHRTIILASILEKEVKSAKDMKVVADIFKKRLAIGMALQADSTLNYATGGTNASLTAAELKIDSPYNSYMYQGLPPTPISNPGINALEAAVYPEANDYYFFLTSPDGQVYYGRTLDEHNKNRQYLR